LAEMKKARLLVVDVSGGQRGDYEWFVRDEETGDLVLNGDMSCDGIAEEEAIIEASGIGYQVVYMKVIDAPKDGSAQLLETREYDLIPGETRLFAERRYQ
jgi:hypothetical protein